MQLTPLMPILAAVSFEQAFSRFLDFMQVISIVFGLAQIVGGVWRFTRGEMAEAFAPIAGGFLLCMAVPIIRMFAGWIGINL
jgi:hypothetical protein